MADHDGSNGNGSGSDEGRESPPPAEPPLAAAQASAGEQPGELEQAQAQEAADGVPVPPPAERTRPPAAAAQEAFMARLAPPARLQLARLLRAPTPVREHLADMLEASLVPAPAPAPATQAYVKWMLHCMVAASPKAPNGPPADVADRGLTRIGDAVKASTEMLWRAYAASLTNPLPTCEVMSLRFSANESRVCDVHWVAALDGTADPAAAKAAMDGFCAFVIARLQRGEAEGLVFPVEVDGTMVRYGMAPLPDTVRVGAMGSLNHVTGV